MEDPDPEVATDLHDRPVDILRSLVQFETVNPPGNERPCIEWIGEVLEAYGIEYETYAKDPDRPNLLARIPGGEAPPLLLYGHVDVVPTTGQDWTHDPFEGVVEDGFVWGRGTLDMKGGVAMLMATFLRMARSEEELAGDLLFLVVSDEESGGDDGLRFLVEEHPELFEDVEYALGEFGGYSYDFGGIETYPIQVNEKQVCWLEVTFRGKSGHASLYFEDTAVGKLGRFVSALDGTRLPVNIRPSVSAMIEAIADAVDPERAQTYQALLDPEQTDEVLESLGPEAQALDPLLHNTANVTMVHGGDKENVVPEEATAFLDCRLVPGDEPEDVIAQLSALTDVEPDEFEVVRFDPGPPTADLDFYEDLAAVLEEATDGIAIPLVMSGATDGRHLAKVDVQSYGFLPMQLGDLPFLDLVHSGDERIPVETLEWGTQRICEAVTDYNG